MHLSERRSLRLAISDALICQGVLGRHARTSGPKSSVSTPSISSKACELWS